MFLGGSSRRFRLAGYADSPGGSRPARSLTVAPVHDRLRSLWDFEDLDGTEQRLDEQLEREGSDSGRAEVLTQLARVEGLPGRFSASETLLQQAEALAGSSDVVRARIDLERCRALRSSGDVAASLPLFESAFAIAAAAGEDFMQSMLRTWLCSSQVTRTVSSPGRSVEST